ncbi:hypothetical protein EDD15DRAFT_1665057 [Pisolithus albus]|nr:hypothetical protein EDD15DRAFT_1665057 [Pisolithus albus]
MWLRRYRALDADPQMAISRLIYGVYAGGVPTFGPKAGGWPWRSSRLAIFELRSVAIMNLGGVSGMYGVVLLLRVEWSGPPFGMIVKNSHDVECCLLANSAVRSRNVPEAWSTMPLEVRMVNKSSSSSH